MVGGVPTPISKSALDGLTAELERLETVERSAIAAQIKTAREIGDLSENAEYHQAKETQGLLEAKIAQIQAKIRDAEVIELSDQPADAVGYGSKVELSDKSGRVVSYTLVSSHEAAADKGMLSIESPLAKALMGLSVGSTCKVETPGGKREFQLVSIS
jgi:transcription elongation factor GreA